MKRPVSTLLLALTTSAAVWWLPDLAPSGPALNFDVAGSITGGRLLAGMALVYLSGLGTSLTPCVYPLIPITLSVMGVKKGGNRLSNVGLASAYVAGMVATYDGVGLILILTHRLSGSLLGNPWVVTPIAALFAVLALPMFGVFELTLPESLQSRLNQVGGPGAVGAFAMGLVAGLVAAPCSGPVTVLIAAVVGETGRLALGIGMMTVYAIGIGTLFFLLAAFSVQLPRGGEWMEAVKSVFGIALMTLALLYLKDAYPFLRTPLAELGATVKLLAPIAAVVAGVGVLLGALQRSLHGPPAERWLKVAGLTLVVGGAFLRIGAGTATASVAPSSAVGSTDKGPPLIRFLELPDGLKRAQADHRPLLIDFGAEWCAACKELEKKVYPDPGVRAEAARFVAVKVDGTNDSDDLEKLYGTYGVGGLPTVVFFDSNGKGRDDLKLVGYEEPVEFVARLKKIP